VYNPWDGKRRLLCSVKCKMVFIQTITEYVNVYILLCVFPEMVREGKGNSPPAPTPESTIDKCLNIYLHEQIECKLVSH